MVAVPPFNDKLELAMIGGFSGKASYYSYSNAKTANGSLFNRDALLRIAAYHSARGYV